MKKQIASILMGMGNSSHSIYLIYVILRDGDICRTEWLKFIVDWHRVFDENLKAEFDQFDSDHSRNLSRVEFNKLVRSIMERYVSHVSLETLQ